jgi:hypothetical protein
MIRVKKTEAMNLITSLKSDLTCPEKRNVENDGLLCGLTVKEP